MGSEITILSADSPERAMEEVRRLRNDGQNNPPPTSSLYADNSQGTTDKRSILCYVEDRGNAVGLVAVEPGRLDKGATRNLDVSGRSWYVTAFQFHFEALVGGQWVGRAGNLFVAGAGKYFPVCGIKWVPALSLTADEQPDIELNSELDLPVK
jgi:hypothetical protein